MKRTRSLASSVDPDRDSKDEASPKIHQAAGIQMKGTEDEYFDFEQLTKS